MREKILVSLCTVAGVLSAGCFYDEWEGGEIQVFGALCGGLPCPLIVEGPADLISADVMIDGNHVGVLLPAATKTGIRGGKPLPPANMAKGWFSLERGDHILEIRKPGIQPIRRNITYSSDRLHVVIKPEEISVEMRPPIKAVRPR